MCSLAAGLFGPDASGQIPSPVGACLTAKADRTRCWAHSRWTVAATLPTVSYHATVVPDTTTPSYPLPGLSLKAKPHFSSPSPSRSLLYSAPFSPVCLASHRRWASRCPRAHRVTGFTSQSELSWWRIAKQLWNHRAIHFNCLLAVIKCIYLPPTYLHFMQDIEDRCLLLTSSMSFVDLPFQENIG
jgi:hypothetical protein